MHFTLFDACLRQVTQETQLESEIYFTMAIMRFFGDRNRMKQTSIAEKVRTDRGLEPSEFARVLATSLQTVRAMCGIGRKATEGVKYRTLCLMRRVSGMTWAQFGAELDERYLKK